MSPRRDDTAEAAARLIAGAMPEPRPEIALVLGSGLDAVAQMLEPRAALAYDELPGFPAPGIEGHAGRLSIGTAAGTALVVLHGRVHYYETGRADAMAAPLRALARAGCRELVMTNAAGSLHRTAGPGSLMLVSDHVNLSGANPLVGAGGGGGAFVDMSDAYDAALRRVMLQAAGDAGVDLHEGVYACFSGPSFETPAEIRAAAVLGADSVGMSIVPETIIARHLGLRVVAVNVITNFAAGVGDEPLGHAQTMRAASAASGAVRRLLEAYLRRRAAG